VPEFSRTRVFAPLGLTRTSWRDDYTRIVKGRAIGYARGPAGFRQDMPFENVHGNGGLLTTVGDLLIWTQNLETGRVGGPRFLALMHEQGVLNSGERIAYARGLSVGTFNGQREVSHTGATAGYRAYLGRVPDQKIGVALLCNIGAVNPGSLGHDVAALFLPAPPARAAPRPAQNQERSSAPLPSLTPAQMQQYVGEYYSADAEVTFNVVLENNTLRLRRRPNARMALQATAEDAFASPLGPIRFLRDASGRVTEFSLSQARVYDLRFTRTK
jgi:hypothetical protein